MTEHRQRPDVVALLEQQRQVRIKLGHETPDGGGIRRDGTGFSSGQSTTPDPTEEMFESLRRQRRYE